MIDAETSLLRRIVEKLSELLPNRQEWAWFLLTAGQVHAGILESPIERALYLTLIGEMVSRRNSVPLVCNNFNYGQPIPSNTIILCPQVLLGSFRVDFLVVACDGRDHPVYVAIECDGHEFHERTKEQAKRDRARDRAIQAMGIPVFRFTGQEIWQEPSGCAREVMALIDDILAKLNEA